MRPLQIITCCLLFFNYSCLSYLSAQGDVKFEHYRLEDGLPEDQTYYIIQDKFGFLWIATNAGLARFDGHRFKVYKYDSEDPNSLSNNLVFCIYLDRNGILWVATGNGLNQLDRENNNFIRYLFNAKLEKGFNTKFTITSITEDNIGNLWLGSLDGLIRFAPKTKKIIRYKQKPEDEKSLINNQVERVYWDSQNLLWVGTSVGLDRFDTATSTFTHYLYDSLDTTSISNNYIYGGFVEDKQSNIWVATYGGGLNKFDRKTGFFQRYQHNPNNENSLCNDFIWYLNKDAQGNIMISTDDGFDRLDPLTDTFFHFRNDPNNPYSLMGNYTLGFLQDAEGNLWIGSNDKGINHLYANQNRFLVLNSKNNLPIGQINAIDADKNGNLWIGAEMGLFCMNKITKQFIHYKNDPLNENSLSHNMVSDVLVDEENIIWIAMNNGGAGLDRLDPNTGKFTHYWHDPNDAQSISSDGTMCLFQDRKGYLWIGGVGNQGGLNRMDRHSYKFTRYLSNPDNPNSLSSNLVHKILEDQEGYIWVGTRFGGLDYLDVKTNRFTHFQPNTNGKLSLAGFEIKHLYLDRKGNIWIGTLEEKGIYRYNPKTKEFNQFLEQTLTRFITGMCEDRKGNFWITTHGQGIIKFNPDTGIFRQYQKEDGLSSLVTRAVFHDPYTGKIYFSDSEGLVEFHPDSIKDSENPPPVFITTLKTYQKDINSDKIIEVETDIAFKKNITLSFKKNTLGFQFAVLSFGKPTKNQYAYQLEGFSDQWIPLGTKNEVTFTNLSPGRYTLRVKGANGDGYWNETPAELHIRITPPWYWAWYSQSLYALLLLGGIYSLYRFQLNRRLALAEAARLQELDQVKTRLYTNITHEFRTPLTIILGMVKQIRADSKQWLDEGLQMIQRNGQNLLRLVNQILDLTKLESGAMPVHLIQGDIIVYLRYLTESFHSYAESKDVGLHFLSEQEELVMDYDADKIMNIVSNLLSNAVKFTPKGGTVYLQVGKVEDGYLPIQVRDTGMGIAEEKLPFIFDRFYQADDSATRQGEGTGIGLALTKELVKLLEGRIEVKSKLGKGSVFSVWLPVRNAAPLGLSLPTMIDIEKEAIVPNIMTSDFISQEALPTALIVEDNEDVVRYLSTCLQGKYNLKVAYDGQEGIEKAIEIVPDIIISDVMMPRKDGFELCDNLKNDWHTSHIPIVLLTAKADVESRISGLRKGADAYLAKPFEEEELLVILEKLLELRKKLQAKYSSQVYLADPAPHKIEAETELEDAFILRVRQVIEEHLDDYELDVTKLCQLLTTSRTQLHNKLKALTGMSTTEFIRSIRLLKAKELLQTTDLNISEIAYDCGFQNPHYFTRVFNEAEGCSPTEFRERNTKN